MTIDTQVRPVLTLLRDGRVEGDLPLVTKGPIDHLAEEDLDLVRDAERLHRRGRENEAKAMVAALETKLGITAADRAAAFAPQEPWESALLAALSREPEARGPSPTSGDPRHLTDAEKKSLDAATAELARARTKGNREIAQGKIARLAERLQQRIELSARADGIAETVALAKARGEDVNETPPCGAVEIESRDGLHRLHKLGHLTVQHMRAATAYRAGYEARGRDLRAQVFDDVGGGAGHDNDAFVEKRLRRAKLLDYVARVDRAVALGCIGDPKALQLLRSVAGEGTAITAWGRGRALARNRDALARALDIAVRLLRAPGEGSGNAPAARRE